MLELLTNTLTKYYTYAALQIGQTLRLRQYRERIKYKCDNGLDWQLLKPTVMTEGGGAGTPV